MPKWDELYVEFASPALRQALLRRVVEVNSPARAFASFDNKLTSPRSSPRRGG